MNKALKATLALVAAGFLTASGFGQVVLTSDGQIYSQNFDTLANAGTPSWANNSTLTGWYANLAGSGTPATYLVSTGTSTTGAIFSYGAASATDRALGSLGSNSTGTITYGVNFLNSSTGTLDSLSISYDGEQWRNGGNTTAQSLTFEYSLDATSLTTGTWTSIAALTFTSPIATSSAAALDGNALANRVSGLSVVLSSLNVSSGSSMWVRVTDLNDSGSDHGLAIDNFSATAGITSIPEPSTYATFMGVVTMGVVLWRRRSKKA